MSNTKYIVDAIKNGIDRVKVVVNGVVTEANSKEALEQLHKPINQRKGIWVSAEPYVEAIHGKKPAQTPIVEEPIISEDASEELTSKKVKKQKSESDES